MAVDKYPQWLNIGSLAESAANTYTEVEVQAPARLSAFEVLEILGVEFRMNPGGTVADADEDAVLIFQVTETTQTGNVNMNNPDLISQVKQQLRQEAFEATETGGAGWAIDQTMYVDYAAGGNGFLSAAQSLFLGIQGTGHAAISSCSARLLYKIVKVSANELIGLVSQ